MPKREDLSAESFVDTEVDGMPVFYRPIEDEDGTWRVHVWMGPATNRIELLRDILLDGTRHACLVERFTSILAADLGVQRAMASWKNAGWTPRQPRT